MKMRGDSGGELNRSYLAVKMVLMKLGGFLALVAALVLTGCAHTPPPVSDKVASYYSNPPKPPETRVIAALGDSYTGGSDMGGYKLRNWTQQLAGMLSTDDVTVYAANLGLGGSGYVKRGPTGKVIGEAVPDAFNDRTDIAVMFGSINDEKQDLGQVEAAAGKAVADQRAMFPEAALVIIGPAWKNGKPPAAIYGIRDALAGVAAAHGATFVDPLAEGWFFDAPELIGADNVHPTDDGHAYMAEKIAPHIQPLLLK